jgi:signal transduction histidine kinase/ActR/RegA family two-component response regulator
MLVVVLITVSTISYSAIVKNTESIIKERIDANKLVGRYLSLALSNAFNTLNWQYPVDLIDDLIETENITWITVTKPDGSVYIGRSKKEQHHKLIGNPSQLKMDGDAVIAPIDIDQVQWFNEQFYVVNHAIKVGSKTWFLSIGGDATPARLSAQTAAWKYVLEGLVVFAFALVLTLLFTRRIVIPISILAAAAEKLAKGETTDNLTVKSNDEIGELTNSFNNMVNDLTLYRKTMLESLKQLEYSRDHLKEQVNDKTLQYRQAKDHAEDISKELSVQIIEKDQRADELKRVNEEKDQIRQETDKAKTEFISTVSHELRTPLNAIIGLSSVLVSDTSEISPAKQTEYLSAINDSGQHLLQIIGDILDISKLDSGARTLEHNPFTVLEVLDICYKTFSFTCQNKGINLTIDNQFNEACPVVGDITVLKQILFNLLSNAIKFTEAGSVSLAAAPQLASESDPNPGIIFTVTDTGKGINADAIPRLFNPFTQEDDSITRSFGGSGLGLNIAQKLAQLMDGEIICTSSVGHGSTFELVLYLEKESNIPEKLNVNKAKILKLPPLKLLVVDDVELNLLVAIAQLEPYGHTIETVSSGRLAVDMASNNDYDAILMDIHMPDISGIEATKLIRNFTNKQRAAVTIIALSADVDASQQTRFIDAGMNSALGKPWTVEDLEKKLKHLLNPG